ncbi:MAG TPA: hypothetical protein VGO92_07795 [Acidimicrobiales bacterium]|jgi:hypothetical protein|nr:hypothetical protein [Acidimicrobiales bacterium]
MANARRAICTKPNEDGAILVTAAILLTALAAFAGLTLAGGAVYAAAQEGRKAADLAALGAAANLPTLSLGTTPNPLGLPGPNQLDTPLGTVALDHPLPTLASDFTLGACAIAGRQFGAGRAPVTDHYATAPPTCTPQAHLANAWLQSLADCLGGPRAAAGCASGLEAGLASFLPPPAPTSPAVSALQSATAQTGAAGQVVTTDLAARLRALNTALGGRLTPLLNQLNNAGGVSVDMTRLAPALLTPEITVTVTQQVDVPGGALLGAGPVTVTSQATARRAVKNAVVVPAVDLPRADGTIVFDANPALSSARDAAFSALQQTGALVAPAADQALRDVACPGSTAACPTVSTSFDDALRDLHDAVDPPNGTAPSAASLVADAVASGQPIMVAAAGYIVNPRQVLGSTVYSLPGVAQLLPALLFVPALDMVPAVLSAGPLGRVVATPIDTAVAAARTRGLYRARLVD